MFFSNLLIIPKRSPLALLMAWIHFADHKSFSLALDNPAVLATFFDRRKYFHGKPHTMIVRSVQNMKRHVM